MEFAAQLNLWLGESHNDLEKVSHDFPVNVALEYWQPVEIEFGW